MISIEQIKNFYPSTMSGNATFLKYILKEYLQLLVLDYLSTTHHVRKITFIGGTNLRLIKGIDRFSEDLDFDCKAFSEEEFVSMSDDVHLFLQRSGLAVEIRDKANSRLTAFRRSLHFPELLFDLNLSGHKEERLLLKLEAQDQGVPYESSMALIKGCGFVFSFPVPPDTVLCAMKISAMLARSKGRDYYDTMFLLSQTEPDYSFLAARCGIGSLPELKGAVSTSLQSVDLNHKQRDFEHLLFNRQNSARIQQFPEFIRSL
jgi:predicted nucleotidyltransferase component of viral defense system